MRSLNRVLAVAVFAVACLTASLGYGQAGVWQIYEPAFADIHAGNIDWDTDDFQVILLGDGHTVDLVNDTTVSDIVADEIADGDYARQAILAAATTRSYVSNVLVYDCSDIDFGNTVTIAAEYAVIAKDTDTDASDQVLFIVDLNGATTGNVSSTSSDFDITIAAGGVHQFDPNGP